MTNTIPDFAEIKGQEYAKRSLLVALTGNYSVLMTGSPGNGKTMLAEASKNIVPETIIVENLPLQRITAIRKITNNLFSFNYPLIMTSWPCPCGNYTHPKNRCRCTVLEISNYFKKPKMIFDLIDIFLEIPPVYMKQYTGNESVSSKEIQEQRLKALAFAKEVPQTLLETRNENDNLCYELLSLTNFSARGIYHTIRVARTIANLGQSEFIKPEHISEAIQYKRILLKCS